jgi:hypothetical protein
VADPMFDRREIFQPAPRPAWMKTLNDIGEGLDIKGVAPMTAESLMQQATANTGLTDFGADDWLEAFTILTRAIDEEADLHLAGRLLTRAELIIYLEARLRITDWIRRHPEVEQEVIDKPVYITGYGRSGTTILFEVLSQDPRFRVVQKWEAMFPVPPPEEATYRTDPRIAKTEGVNRFIEETIPEMGSMHKIGGDLPVEAIEMEYLSFVSEIFLLFMQVPSYAAYLKTRDLSAAFEWQKTIFKLLQSRFRREHWLLKSPSHFPHFEKYINTFPGMQVIFSHRDPLVTADSVISFMGTLLWQRTDNLWGDGKMEVEVLATADGRARAWDPIIEMIEDGRLAKGQYANFYYDQFVDDPIKAVQSVYDQLGMTLTPEVAERMRAYLAAKTKGQFGKHQYEQAPLKVVESERVHYEKYQRYFAVPNEI